MDTSANSTDQINARLRRHLDRSLQEAALAITRRHVELGRRIRLARDAKGWKQKQLAAACNVEPTTVSRWETGAHAPEMHTLRVIASSLDRPLSYFVNVAEEPLTGPPVDPDVELTTRVEGLEVAVDRLGQQVQTAAVSVAARLTDVEATLRLLLERDELQDPVVDSS